MRQYSVHRFILTVAATCLLGAQATQAQVAPGQRLHITHGIQTVAEGVYLNRDSLGYAVLLSGSDTVRIPMDGGYAAERFTGRKPYGWRAVGKGVAVGAGVGLGLLGLTALSSDQHEKGVAYALGIVVTVGLTVAGAVVGVITAVSDHDVWQPVAFTPDVAIAVATSIIVDP